MVLMIATGHEHDMKEHGSRKTRCRECGKRGRMKCYAGVCLNFCCMTKKGLDRDEKRRSLGK